MLTAQELGLSPALRRSTSTQVFECSVWCYLIKHNQKIDDDDDEMGLVSALQNNET